MSSTSKKCEDINREIKRPTLTPMTFTRWSKEYLIEAVGQFGDAGKALRDEAHPEWRKMTCKEYFTKSATVSLEKLNALQGIEKEEYKIRMKQFIDRQASYENTLKKLHADILQHLSDESMNLLTRDNEEYARCERSQDPMKLWKLLRLATRR